MLRYKRVDRTVPTTKKCRQTTHQALEQALKPYLRDVVPSQRLVRAAVTEAFEQSVARNRDLLQRLAKQPEEPAL